MAQSVWHRQDIENVLRGVALSCQQMAAQIEDPALDGYRRGFLAALAATATSFGIPVDMQPLSAPPHYSLRSAAPSRHARDLSLAAAPPDR
jgi:hypothetical protein